VALGALTLMGAFGKSSLQASDWPEFRGPTRDGQAPKAWKLPTNWDEASNVAWKTPISGKAWSTPVVSGGKAWLATATEDGKVMSVVCVDAGSGKVLHEKVLFENESPEPLGNPVNSYGSSSPAIEGKRVYIHFGSYGTACLDTDSAEVIWQRRDLPCRHFRGPGSSVVLYKEFVILTMDGIDVQYTVALQQLNGETVWKTDRTTEWDDLGPDGEPISEGDMRKAYSTPVVASIGKKDMLISTGAKCTYGYDPMNGKELWRVTYKGFSNASRPVFANGTALINTGYGKANLVSIPLHSQSRGDLTGTAEWEITKRVPLRSSPVVVGGHIFMISDNGVAACVRMKDGEELWSERLDGKFSASPIHHQGHVYFFSEEGASYVVEAKPEYVLASTNKLEEGMMASPAAADGALFLRTKGHLYKIAE
jgi:outer membrane protein assembly factor BamB